ncbi:hypothetical protein OAF83_00605 [Rubripirellula sp.]|jgi:hypothetical protein|nr:hypothetical protein [Rubripirellula sp.]MDB4749382.1 hypothetical protein [Rubripirellula sp.]
MSTLLTFGRALEQKVREARIVYRFPKARQARETWRHDDRKKGSGKHLVLLDIRSSVVDGEGGRRFHALVSLLLAADCRIWIVPHLRFFQSFHKCFKRQAMQKIEEDGERSPKRYDLCISDRYSHHPRANKTLRITTATLREILANEMPFPYGMHPDVYQSGQGFELEPFRQQQRIWRLFFGGYRAQGEYRENGYYCHLPTTNRFEIIEEALDFYADQIHSADSHEAFVKITKSECHGFTFIDSGRYRLPGKEWLKTLSLADFFLAAPGTTYPMSHNCVESLAVGTIPVLEYASVFRPALTDGVNCLTYQGKKGLRRTLTSLQGLDALEIERLRKGALEYYDKHLGPKRIVQQLMQPNVSKLHLHAHLAKPAA